MERASEPLEQTKSPRLPVPERSGSEAVEAIVHAYSMLEHQATVLREQIRHEGSASKQGRSGPLGPRLRMGFPPVGSAAAAVPDDALERTDTEALIRQARMILSAMAAGDGAGKGRDRVRERRRGVYHRRQFEVPARLRLWADGEGGEPWFVYTRDAEPRGLGFITPDRLPLGYGGTLMLTGPDGRSMKMDVTLVRCTAACGGWFHGGLTFVRPQHVFAELLDLNGCA